MTRAAARRAYFGQFEQQMLNPVGAWLENHLAHLDRKARVEGCELGHISDLWAGPAGSGAKHLDGPGGGLEESENELQQSGFAPAVGSDYAREIQFLHRQIDVRNIKKNL